MNNSIHPLSLWELNNKVAEIVNDTFDHPFWIVAELSEVRTASNGHCYLEFIDKQPDSNSISARARGVIWAQRWRLLRMAFEEATRQTFAVGLKVLVQVQVRMHELYGYSLEVQDIDPSYTMGEISRQRAEIIAQLSQAGIINMNKELEFPQLPQRIAVISAANAAGYGDFIDQLHQSGYAFYPHLFAAAVQGNRVEESIIEALDRIYNLSDLFDIVVIIRGGGATADLKCFDSYAIAEHCAQFPLPIIVGIGHERDTTVLDIVAHTRVKTPTAAAVFLIDKMKEQETTILNLQGNIIAAAQNGLKKQEYRLDNLLEKVKQTHYRIADENRKLDYMRQSLCLCARQRIQNAQQHLRLMEQATELANPLKILKRGFSITRVNGKAITSAQMIHKGDVIQTQTADGRFESTAN